MSVEPGPIRQPNPTIEAARLALLRLLARAGYQMTTPAPSTHRRVLLRRGRAPASSLEDVFGWSLPFHEAGMFADLAPLMEAGGMLWRRGPLCFSALRVASVEGLLFYHSAFPPRDRDSVFLGPDSYRFAAFIRAQAQPLAKGAVICDIGAGAGVGGVFAHSLAPKARLVLSDVSRRALDLARTNAAFAGQAPQLRVCEGLPEADGPFDLILANPPYLGGSPGKTYSDGGGALGAGVTLDWTRQALAQLKPGGRFLLYSGAAIARGHDGMRQALAQMSEDAGCGFAYEELNPDVFPSTLLHRAYWGVERIAAVGAVMTRPGEA